ncbi:anti-sigma factor domain-containing protein [Priestia koreensis]|uniref:anti-sigma factor domain-containing protein n=1 Tax=Priestia koreensis TaxID=284581 RepID=UPI0028F73305|nr:anti-sigma factor domain-containing protein [Priestia koreensis]
MKKGIIMEIQPDYVTMLTPDGEFVKARYKKRHYAIGEEVEGHEVFIEATKEKKKRRTKLALVPLFVAALLLLSFIPYYSQNQVYAYMSIDINPSLELELDRHMNVTDIHAYNKEGKTIIKKLPKWKKRPVHEVTTNIITLSQKEGYLQKKHEIYIATALKRKNVHAYKKKLQEQVQTITTEWTTDDVRVTAKETSYDTREKAEKQGVSTGAYLRAQPVERSNEQEEKMKPSVPPSEKVQDEKRESSSVELSETTDTDRKTDADEHAKKQKEKQDQPPKPAYPPKERTKQENEQWLEKEKEKNEQNEQEKLKEQPDRDNKNQPVPPKEEREKPASAEKEKNNHEKDPKHSNEEESSTPPDNVEHEKPNDSTHGEEPPKKVHKSAVSPSVEENADEETIDEESPSSNEELNETPSQP